MSQAGAAIALAHAAAPVDGFADEFVGLLGHDVRRRCRRLQRRRPAADKPGAAGQPAGAARLPHPAGPAGRRRAGGTAVPRAAQPAGSEKTGRQGAADKGHATQVRSPGDF